MAAEIVWVGGLDDGHLGETIFPDDGSRPIIQIGVDKIIPQAMDILAHELAHVAAGPEAGHDATWESAYDAIHRKYTEIIEAEAGDLEG